MNKSSRFGPLAILLGGALWVGVYGAVPSPSLNSGRGNDRPLFSAPQFRTLDPKSKKAYASFLTVPAPPAVELQIWNGQGSYGSEFFGFSSVSIQQDWTRKDVKWWYRLLSRDSHAVRAVWQVARFEFPQTVRGWRHPPGLILQGELQSLASGGQWTLFQVDYTKLAPSPGGPREGAESNGLRAEYGKPSGQALRPPASALDRTRAMLGLPMPVTFHARVILLDAKGMPVGRPSTTIALTFAPPRTSGMRVSKEGLGHPTVHFLSYRPARADAADSLCIYRSVRDWVDPMSRRVIFPAGSYFDMCQPKDSSILDDLADAVGDVIGALGDLVNWVAQAYESAKESLLGVLVGALKGTVGCGSACQSLVRAAMDAGLAAIGLPPTIPNFDQMVDMGADYLATKIAEEAGLPEEVTEKAIQAFVSEVRSGTSAPPGGVFFVPDPDRQYRPAHVLLEVTNRGASRSRAVVLQLVPDPKSGFLRSDVPLPSLAAGRTIRVPVFLQPTDDPGAWRRMLPTAQDLGSLPGWDAGQFQWDTDLTKYQEKYVAAMAARDAWERKYAYDTSTFNVSTSSSESTFDQFRLTVGGQGAAVVR